MKKKRAAKRKSRNPDSESGQFLCLLRLFAAILLGQRAGFVEGQNDAIQGPVWAGQTGTNRHTHDPSWSKPVKVNQSASKRLLLVKLPGRIHANP